jgi:two-component system chemotaxis response regulator CheY
MKILVVDDMPSMRSVICHILDNIGYSDTEQATDGVQALTMLRDSKFDFVISDWNMLKMNGQQLLENIRSEELLQHISVLMVTAETEKSIVVKAAQSGVNAYIVKPFSPQQLQEKMAQIFP